MAVAGRGGAEPMAREWCLGTIIAMSVGIQVLFHVLVSAVPPRGRSRTRTASPPRVPATDFFCPAPEPEEPRVAVGIVDGSADGIVDGIVDGIAGVDGSTAQPAKKRRRKEINLTWHQKDRAKSLMREETFLQGFLSLSKPEGKTKINEEHVFAFVIEQLTREILEANNVVAGGGNSELASDKIRSEDDVSVALLGSSEPAVTVISVLVVAIVVVVGGGGVPLPTLDHSIPHHWH